MAIYLQVASNSRRLGGEESHLHGHLPTGGIKFKGVSRGLGSIIDSHRHGHLPKGGIKFKGVSRGLDSSIGLFHVP